MHCYAIDVVVIIDLVYMVPLLVAVIWAWWGEFRSWSRRVVIGVLVFTTVYFVFGFVQFQRVIV